MIKKMIKMSDERKLDNFIKKCMLNLLITIMCISFVFAESNTDESEPYIDPQIYISLNESASVRVVISIRELTNKSNERVKSEIISNLSDSEFNLQVNLEGTDWFAGELTREGLEKLSSNNNILKIEKDKIGGLVSQNNYTSSTNYIIKDINLENSNKIQYIIAVLIIILIFYWVIKKRKRFKN